MASIVLNKTVSLNAPIIVESLHGVVFSNESNGHKFVISCMQDGELVNLTGSVSARFMRSNGTTILLESGEYSSIVDGKAVVTLHQDCYNVIGRFQMAVFLTEGSTSTCIYACVGSVQRSEEGTLIDSGEAVPSLDELLARIDACEQATTNATAAASAANAAAESASTAGDNKFIRYDAAQSLTANQQAQARANIGASTGAVLYSETQTLNDAQKTVARSNIEAASATDVDDLRSAINVLATQEQLTAVYGKLMALVDAVEYFAENAVYTSDSSGPELADMIKDVKTEEVLSIEATYTGGKVPAGSSLDSIKQDILCRAMYSSGLSAYVTSFSLSGTITSGNNTVTVSYEGKTDTITVVGVALLSISAVYGGSSVIEGSNLDVLRDDLVVTAYYDDNTSETVTNYTLSGTIVIGTNTITVTYATLTTTFEVTGIRDVMYGLTFPDRFAQSGATTTNTFGGDGFPLTYATYKLVVSFIMCEMAGHSIVIVGDLNGKLFGYNSSGWFVSSGIGKPSETFVLDTENLSTMTITNISPSMFNQGGTIKFGADSSGFNGPITFASYKIYGVDTNGNETLLSDVRPTSIVGQLEDRAVNTKTTAIADTTGYSVIDLEA